MYRLSFVAICLLLALLGCTKKSSPKEAFAALVGKEFPNGGEVGSIPVPVLPGGKIDSAMISDIESESFVIKYPKMSVTQIQMNYDRTLTQKGFQFRADEKGWYLGPRKVSLVFNESPNGGSSVYVLGE